jgi:hypothetical protein
MGEYMFLVTEEFNPIYNSCYDDSVRPSSCVSLVTCHVVLATLSAAVFYTDRARNRNISFSFSISASIRLLFQNKIVLFGTETALSPRSCGLSSASHRGGPGSRLVRLTWDLLWKKWHWDTFFSEFFDFPLSVSFHRGSPYLYIIWWMDSRLVDGRSSET